MEEIKVKDIIRICNGKLLCGNPEGTIENFKKDTREIENRRYIYRNTRRKS